MMDATIRIKNLYNALEALSHLKLDVYFSKVEMLLAASIIEAKREYQWPHKALAKPYHDYTKDPFANPDDNDELQPYESMTKCRTQISKTF